MSNQSMFVAPSVNTAVNAESPVIVTPNHNYNAPGAQGAKISGLAAAGATTIATTNYGTCTTTVTTGAD